MFFVRYFKLFKLSILTVNNGTERFVSVIENLNQD